MSRAWWNFAMTSSAPRAVSIPSFQARVPASNSACARESRSVGCGPKTAHSYEKGAKEEVNRLIDAIVAKGKPEWPAEVKFVTYTTRYNRCAWVEVMLLEKHWERAEVTGTYKDGKFDVKTKGVWSLSIHLNPKVRNTVVVDGQMRLFPGARIRQVDARNIDGLKL